MMNSKSRSKLLEHQNALGSYLDDMLQLATEVAELIPQNVEVSEFVLLPELSPSQDSLNELISESQADINSLLDVASSPASQTLKLVEQVKPKAEPKIEQEAKAEVKQEIKSEVKQQAKEEVVSVQPTVQSLISAESFPLQCLMFKSNNHQFAIPLIHMNSVINWDQQSTKLPLSADWDLGMIQYRSSKLNIVDSGKLFEISSDEVSQAEHLLVFERSCWAITCDQIDDVISLQYDDVKWNKCITNPLIFGTIRDSLSSLINPVQIIRLLSGDQLKNDQQTSDQLNDGQPSLQQLHTKDS